MADIAANITTKAVLEGVTTGGHVGTYSGQVEFTGDHDWIIVQLSAVNPICSVCLFSKQVRPRSALRT